MTPLLEVIGLRKAFVGQDVLRDIRLTVERGGIFTILGPSGAGKSVFLKCVTGTLTPDAGEIRFDGNRLAAGGRVQADFRRRCSFLFQNNALFDSLTALENVSLPLEQTTKLPVRLIRERAMDALRRLEMDAAAQRYPEQLSGGMQKRLALARALVTGPEMVFFDEPTAGLDPLRRNAVFAMIARYQHALGFTALLVTHDVPEALAVSNRVALLEKGSLHFEGTPGEFAQSSDPTVRAFRDSVEALGSTLTGIRSQPA